MGGRIAVGGDVDPVVVFFVGAAGQTVGAGPTTGSAVTSAVESAITAGQVGSSTPPNPARTSPAAAGSIEHAPTTIEATSSPAPAGVPQAGFSSEIRTVDANLASRMGTSWREGCPVPLSDLRYVVVSYRGFDGMGHTGELVVAASVAGNVADIFGDLYHAGYPIASMRLVDDFGGSDDASMAANNTSAFNGRAVTGGGGFSEHSYGTAIDLNPVQNPYLSGSLVLPEQGRDYLARQPSPGVIEPGDVVVTSFAARGWTWGGTWSGPIDYQHFSVSGR